MSRSDSRQVSWENAITRNKSAQPSVRTPASPLWRSMMRPKVFHGTNSITCENSVLPTFMRYPGSFRPASIANRRSEIQIVDTHESLKTRAGIGFPAFQPRFNRTAVELGFVSRSSLLVSRIRLDVERSWQRVRTGETTNGHRCSRSGLRDPDERRARGTHSLGEPGGLFPVRQRLLDMIGHSPHRSNLCTSTLARHAV